MQPIRLQWSFRFAETSESDAAARNTAIELDRIHNGTGSTAIDKAESLQSAITQHPVAVLGDAMDYLASKSPVHRERIRLRVSRRAPYAALVRSHLQKFPEIAALFD